MRKLEVLTHSKRQTFRACRRAYFYRHEQHLESRIPKASRRRGSAFAQALHAAYEEIERLRDRELDVHPGAIEPLVESAVTGYYEEIHPSSQAEADECAFEEHAIRVLVFEYLQTYGLEGRREVEYTRPLVNPQTGRSSRSFVLGGKIDGIKVVGFKHAQLIEDKLYSQISQAQIDQLVLDEQTSEYVDALLWKGWRSDVLYRITRWPSIRQKKGETLDGFMERFTADVTERHDFYFVEQGPLIFPVDQMDEFRLERWQIAKDILQTRRSGTWYKNPSRCDLYGGGCQFTPLCTCQPGAEDLYIVREDNPELERSHEE